MPVFSILDLVALAGFIGAWCAYAFLVEWTRHGRGSLNARIDPYREIWMRRMLARDMRMVDMQIMTAIQNGTAFFASTSLLAIGGALTLLRPTDEVTPLMATLPFGIQASPGLWEAKTIGLIVIFVYAFFKFAWSYRLFNYVAIRSAPRRWPSTRTRRKRTRTSSAWRGCSRPPAATSTAASVRSFSRSAISAGSSARSSSWRRRRPWSW